MKKFLFLLFSSFLVLWFFSFVSATETTPVPTCDEYVNYHKLYEDYLSVTLPVYMNPELTKSNKSQIDLFAKKAGNWIGKKAEGDFLGDGSTGLGDKVSLELNLLNRKYNILKSIDSGTDEVYDKVESIIYTADGIKKFILANTDDINKLFLCSSEIPNFDKVKIKAAYSKAQKLLKTEMDKIKSGKMPKSYIKSVNLAIWKQRVLFEIKNSEDYLKKHCTYEPENEVYNCGG